MKVIIPDKEIYHQSGIYLDIPGAKRKYYSFLKAHEEIKPDIWYRCDIAGIMYDQKEIDKGKITSIDINIHPLEAKTYALRLRVWMSDIEDKLIRFSELGDIKIAELAVRIANLQNKKNQG